MCIADCAVAMQLLLQKGNVSGIPELPADGVKAAGRLGRRCHRLRDALLRDLALACTPQDLPLQQLARSPRGDIQN